MIFSISAVTDAGRLATQRALDHDWPLVFTDIRTGNGIYSEGEDVTARTALKNQKNSYPIDTREDDPNGVTLGAVLTNYDGSTVLVDETYKVNEIGLYCTVNDIEYLYAVAAAPDGTGQELPAYTGDNLAQIVQQWYVALSNTLQIDVALTGAFALQSDLKKIEEMIESNHYIASIADDDGNVIVDDDSNEIAGDWRYQIM